MFADLVKRAAMQDAMVMKERQEMVKAAINYHALQEAKRLIAETVSTHNKFAAAKMAMDQQVLSGRAFVKRAADIDPLREADERAQAGATLGSNGWLWNTLDQHPVASTMAGLGALMSAEGLANVEYNRIINPATKIPFLEQLYHVRIPQDAVEMISARSLPRTGWRRALTVANPFIDNSAEATLNQLREHISNVPVGKTGTPAMGTKDYLSAVDKFRETARNALTTRSSRFGAAAGILGAGGLGYWDWNRGEDSILRDFLGQHKAAINIPLDRAANVPYVNPYRAAAIGAGLGAGAVALGKALAEGGMPSLPNVALGAVTGAGLGAVGANVYNNMTLDYLARPVLNPNDALKV